MTTAVLEKKPKLDLEWYPVMEKKTFLVTGGGGFIGHHLANELMRTKNGVIALDDLSLGTFALLDRDCHVLKAPCVQLEDLEYESPYTFSDIAGIYHLGMPSSSPMYIMNRALVAKTIENFICVLDFARKKKVKVVYASTSSIYNGNPTPWNEAMLIKATDFYTEARFYMERIAAVYYNLYGVESIGLRLFSVYGPEEDHKCKFANLVSQLIWAKQKEERFQIYGDGSQRRDYTYIDDVVCAFLQAMRSSIKLDIFNIGTGVNHSLNSVIARIGTDVEYMRNPIANYVDQTLADTTKAKNFLGFKAVVSLDEGLKRMGL